MKKTIKKYKVIIIAVILYLIFFFVKKDIFFAAIENTKNFLIEMIQVMPPVLIISALISEWVPSEIIKKSLGAKSGLRGKVLSLLIGSVSAGPIYAAFPAVLVLFKKGAGIANMVIILSAWAVIKVPMLLVETSFLGLKFAIVRASLTVPAILIMGTISEKLISRSEIKYNTEENQKTQKDILTNLPNLNCGGCGYNNCDLFAQAVYKKEKVLTDCIVLKNNLNN